MGKKIDRFVLSTLAAAGFYFFYQRAFENRFLSALLAFLSFIVLHKTLRILSCACGRMGWLKCRKLRRNARGAMLSLAALPHEEALKKLGTLVHTCYGPQEIVLFQSHPSLSLPPQQVFQAWKNHRGKERLVVCATCAADAACRSLAGSLKQPRIAIIDADQLSQMIAEHPDGFSFEKNPSVKLRFRLSHIAGLVFNRRNAPRCMLVSLAMLGLYLLSGRITYLSAAAMLMLAALAAFRHVQRPARLF